MERQDIFVDAFHLEQNPTLLASRKQSSEQEDGSQLITELKDCPVTPAHTLQGTMSSDHQDGMVLHHVHRPSRHQVGSSKPSCMQVRLGDLHFSRTTISNTMKDGRTLENLISFLCADAQNLSATSMISIVQCDDKLISMNNHRLYCSLRAFGEEKSVPVHFHSDPASFGTERFNRKFIMVCKYDEVQVHDCGEAQEIILVPDHSAWFVRQQLKDIRCSCAALLQLIGQKLIVTGTKKDVHDAVLLYKYVMADYTSCDLPLPSQDAIKAIRGLNGSTLAELLAGYPSARVVLESSSRPVALIRGSKKDVEALRSLIQDFLKSGTSMVDNRSFVRIAVQDLMDLLFSTFTHRPLRLCPLG